MPAHHWKGVQSLMPNMPNHVILLEIEQTLETGLVITSEGQEPVPDSSPVSDRQSMGTRTQICPIRPCHVEKACLPDDALTMLHSTDNGRPLDTWIPYKGGPRKALNKHAMTTGIGFESAL